MWLQFDMVEEIQAKLQEVMMTFTQKDFKECFNLWQEYWDHYVNTLGDCTDYGFG